MKIPPKIRTYCPHCRKHTEHEVSTLKKRPPRALSLGQRQFARIMRGYGSQPRSEQRKFAKTSKKVALVLKCVECKKSHQKTGFRSKKFEIKA
ncbi:MAG: 50S ribosomal protein L44e [Candidatus Hadarchaeales archaeon]